LEFKAKLCWISYKMLYFKRVTLVILFYLIVLMHRVVVKITLWQQWLSTVDLVLLIILPILY
jgi:hypothetical protein